LNLERIKLKINNYSRTFWVANGVELLERAAFYAMFISISVYLSKVVGYNDIWASIIGGFFSAGVYLLPMFVGALSDKMGFRKSIIIAFLFQSIAYFTLAALPYKMTVFPAYILLMVGGSFIKSLITGTVAKSTTESNRARAFSIFYFIVNIGSFTGKTFAYPVRIELGLEAVNFVSAGLTLIALIAVYLFYKNVDLSHEGKTFKETWNALAGVLLKPKLLFLILIIAGFWLIQHQMYASMPKYILRMVGEHAAPEWIANINPAVVMIFVVIITNFMRKRKAITSLKVGLFIMPFSTILMAMGPYIEKMTGDSISLGLFSLHPITLMMIIGIAFQGLAECFISPRYLEYFSLQAPKGEEGLYLGFSHLHSFFANLIGFFISGFLLDAFCPDPQRADLVNLTPQQLAPYYANADYIWYVFAGIGFLSALSLVVYERVFKYLDSKVRI